MNTPMESQSYTIHRKIAVSFRDKSLLQVFNMTVGTLSKVAKREINATSGVWVGVCGCLSACVDKWVRLYVCVRVAMYVCLCVLARY
jgi:hypothetical protein